MKAQTLVNQTKSETPNAGDLVGSSPKVRTIASSRLQRVARSIDSGVEKGIDYTTRKIKEKLTPSKKRYKKIDKFLAKKAVYKSMVKKGPRATVMLNQPVYLKDKSRFFTDNYIEEKRQLFFS